MFREIEGGHRLELKDINCENWLKLRGAKPFSGGELPPQAPEKTGGKTLPGPRNAVKSINT